MTSEPDSSGGNPRDGSQLCAEIPTWVLWLAASLGGLLVVLLSPYLPDLRYWLSDRFGSGAVEGAVAGVIAVLAALVVIRAIFRARQWVRTTMLLAWAVAFAVSFARIKYPVERFHFIEYGLLAVMFSLAAIRRNPGVPGLFLGLGLAGLVGYADEWVQWLVPIRVGELRDVVLNFWSAFLGTALMAIIGGRTLWRKRHNPRDFRLVPLTLAGLLLVNALFIDQVHLGWMLEDPGIGAFRSYWTGEQLRQITADRRAAIARGEKDPALFIPLEDTDFEKNRWGPEDFYVTEGHGHLRLAEKYVSEKEWKGVVAEYRILMWYYGSILEEAGRVPTEYQWAETLRRAEGAPWAGYVSPVCNHLYTGLTRPVLCFWTILAALALCALSGIFGGTLARGRMTKNVTGR